MIVKTVKKPHGGKPNAHINGMFNDKEKNISIALHGKSPRSTCHHNDTNQGQGSNYRPDLVVTFQVFFKPDSHFM